MQLNGILNRVQKYKAFVHKEVEWGDPGRPSGRLKS